MPLEQTVTIVNNSGKIISTGKQLFSIFKEAKASYDEKKAEIKGLKRAETFDQPRSLQRQNDHRRPRTLAARHAAYEPEYYTEYDYGKNPPEYSDGRSRSLDVYSETSSRRSSHRDSRSQTKQRHQASRSRPALTESNLKTLSEVSSTAPSKAPNKVSARKAYRSPYAETLPKDSRISWMNLTQCDTKIAAEPDWRQSILMPRRRSEPEIGTHQTRKAKEIDMHLAYGNVPPDLADRVDLDPSRTGEDQANQLVRRVEGLLDEAHCVQHSATSIIKHLQEKPEAAAAVALTLAELSAVVGKMSPAFLGLLRSGSPAVFSLLASPQFLIGTGIAVGLTVVMFGGWKIVQRVREKHAAREALAWEGTSVDRPALLRSRSEQQAGSFEEALIVDDELSTIETWRRGILPPGADNESADIELITPVAERAQREKYSKDDLDLRSQRSTRTAKTNKTTTKTCKTCKTSKTSKTQGTSSKGKEKEVPEGRSSRRATVESIAGDSEFGTRKSGSKDKEKERRRDGGVKMIEDGRSSGMELMFRPKAQSQGDNMLKALFKSKDRKERGSRTELVMA